MPNTAQRLKTLMEDLLQAPLPIRLRAWDGSESGPPDTPVLIIRNRRALRRLMWQPNDLGLARAYVSGDLDVKGDLYAALTRTASNTAAAFSLASMRSTESGTVSRLSRAAPGPAADRAV